jgi:hypothetical protein
MNTVEFKIILEETGLGIFADAFTDEELDEAWNFIRSSAASVHKEMYGQSQWGQIRDAAKYALDNCTDSELDIIISHSFWHNPEALGGSRPFLIRLYTTINEAFESR